MVADILTWGACTCLHYRVNFDVQSGYYRDWNTCPLYKITRCPHFRGRIVSVNGNAIYTWAKCPLKCGVHISEVHNCGDFTVLYFEVLYNLFAVEFIFVHINCAYKIFVGTYVLLASTTLWVIMLPSLYESYPKQTSHFVDKNGKANPVWNLELLSRATKSTLRMVRLFLHVKLQQLYSSSRKLASASKR